MYYLDFKPEDVKEVLKTFGIKPKDARAMAGMMKHHLGVEGLVNFLIKHDLVAVKTVFDFHDYEEFHYITLKT
jgi:hypothetical protein